MTITQTVTIPDDHRIMLEIPRDIPAGETQVIIQFPAKEKHKSEGSGIPRITRKEIEAMRKNSPRTQAISGILSSLGDVDLDEWRMKRLAKHL
ncbi:hypothetical protein R84B8_03132 [Treponema sp. R8-4-B8]